MKKRIALSALSLLSVSFGIAWYIRANTWPCRRFESTSGCVSSVQLQIDKLGLERDSIKISYRSFDLSSGAEFVLVGLQGLSVAEEKNTDERIGKRDYAILALFDTKDGSLIRVLRRIKGEIYSKSNYDNFYKYGGSAYAEEAAISEDGSLVASRAQSRTNEKDEVKHSLIVQRTKDGSLVKKIYEVNGAAGGCYLRLDFSPDGKMVQCHTALFQVYSNGKNSLADEKDSEYIVPHFADFSTYRATAPDGTKVKGSKQLTIKAPDSKPLLLNSPLSLYDTYINLLTFSPNSQYFIQSKEAYLEARGKRFFIPPPFRKLSAVALWNRNGELKRMFSTNKYLRTVAWSRDSKYFALINRDLTVQVFKANI